MERDLHSPRTTKFTTHAMASQSRGPLQLLMIASVVSIAGCLGVKFDRDFSSMTVQPSDSLHSLVGAWDGSWQSSAQSGNHAARAAIWLDSKGQYEVHLEMSDFEPEPGASNLPINKYWIQFRLPAIATVSAAAQQFEAKIQLKRAERSELIAEGMTLFGSVHGDLLAIEFRTNDAIHDLDHGRLDLYRLEFSR